jgi:dolichol-phosphate mannosyltransferase
MCGKLVVIPAHNEEGTIYEVVTSALRYADVSVTNDGSSDRTPEILKGIQKECLRGHRCNRLNIITHQQATHIPKAIQDGIRYGVAQGYEYIVTMDAGLSHDPEALPSFFMQDPDIDVVIGSRERPENVPLYRKFLSLMGTFVVNYSLTRSYFRFYWPIIKDCTSGYRRYSFVAAKLIADTKLESKAFDFHMESLALCIRRGMKAKEIPIRYVFSNSSFNENVLKQAVLLGIHLIITKNSLSDEHVVNEGP